MTESPKMQTKLLNHLEDVSKLVEKRDGDRETEELLKANNELVNELQSTAAFETANVLENAQAAWKEVLVQKLIDGDVDLADEKVKEHMNKQMDEIVRVALQIQRGDGKVTFVFDSKKPATTSMIQTIHTRDLVFAVSLYPSTVNSYLYVDCKEIPENMSCKVQLQMTLKNNAGKCDLVRKFGVVYRKTKPNFTLSSLFQREEYEDESLGFLKDGKLEIEISLEAGELVEIKEQDKEACSVDDDEEEEEDEEEECY